MQIDALSKNLLPRQHVSLEILVERAIAKPVVSLVAETNHHPWKVGPEEHLQESSWS
jgi:hypothetical protein